MAFCHLHVHSEYSLLDGANAIPQLVARARELNHPALALTDHGNLLGAYEFFKACEKAGIRPVIGCEVYVAPHGRKKKEKTENSKRAWHLLLLSRTQEGYHNLIRLVSLGYIEGYYYTPRVDHELLAQYAEGLICCTACLSGQVPVQILEQRYTEARQTIRTYQAMFGEGNVYLEVMANGLASQETVNRTLLEFSREMSVPMVATADCHYLTRAHHAMQDVLLCIQTGSRVADRERFRMEDNQYWLKTEAEMRDQLPGFSEAIERTVEVAERCQVDLLNRSRVYHAPAFRLPADRPELDEPGYLRELVWAGIHERYPTVTDAVRQRVEYELDVITRMGFAGYFLIVWDFIRYAREQGITVGPGRGSAAGSIVAYALRIVDIDPLRFNLLFERFLNTDRVSMPDIDIDFDDRRRHEVIEYVTRLYGRDCVAQIVTIGRIKAKNAIRDVGRALGVPLSEVNRIAALVPDGPKVSLANCLNPHDREHFVPDLAREANRPDLRDLFRFALQVEGISRNTGVHAAGVVIGDRPLVDLVPLMITSQDEVATQYTMETLEQLGLLKMDFLGLKNLSIIDDTLDALAERGITIDWDAIDFQDDETYALLRRGQTDGVFQVESEGMKQLLRKLRPNCFEDIIAVLALYRPGPLKSGYVEEYVKAKHGQERISYIDPRLEPILRETYGVIVYQEQAMLIAHTLAGFTMAEADKLRKAMSKKQSMAEFRNQFVEGCVKNGVPRRVADDLYSNIENFGEYCFNKSHTAAYAVLTFRTAYLKAHYPKEFMAAVLTSVITDTTSLLKYIRDAESMGLAILPPDINHSGARFTPTENGIRYGLAGIKGMGTGLVDTIIGERRRNGPFDSVESFCKRVGSALVNAKMVECLVHSGAFDCFGLHRSQLLDLFPRALDIERTERRNAELYGGGLFGTFGQEAPEVRLPVPEDLPEIPFAERLQHERALLGIYVSGHPVDAVRDDIELLATHTLAELDTARHRSQVTVGGVITDLKRRKFQSGERVGIALLEDSRGACELMIPEEVLDQTRHFLENMTLAMVSGTLERRDDSFRIRARSIIPVSEIRSRHIRSLRIDLREQDTEPEKLSHLRDLVRRHPGSARIYFYVLTDGGGPTVVRAGERYAVEPSKAFITALHEVLSKHAIRFDVVSEAISTSGRSPTAQIPPAQASAGSTGTVSQQGLWGGVLQSS